MIFIVNILLVKSPHKCKVTLLYDSSIACQDTLQECVNNVGGSQGTVNASVVLTWYLYDIKGSQTSRPKLPAKQCIAHVRPSVLAYGKWTPAGGCPRSSVFSACPVNWLCS